MSQVLTGVKEKIGDLLPGQIGDNLKWSAAAIERYVMLADRAVRERTGNLYLQQEIDLTTDSEYSLDSKFIDITSVEYASDGSSFNWYLKPATLDDLDKLNRSWRDDGGSRPEYYVILGAPGTPNSKLMIYRPMSSASSQKLRVTGLAIGESTTICSDDIQSKCHVPYVMTLLSAGKSAKEAADWYGKYLDGCDEVRRRTMNKAPSGVTRVKAGW